MRPMLLMARLLTVLVLSAVLLASCGGGGSSSRAASSSQGFIPAPAQSASATSTASSTATASPSSVATAAPTATSFATPDVAASAQANGCAVTPFAKSGPPQVKALLYPQWYGQGDLWFAPSSYYAGTNLQQLGNASVWFQGTVPAVALTKQAPRVTGHLMSDPSTTLTATPGTTNELVGQNGPTTPTPPEKAHGINISLPKPGCWQLTVTSGSETLNVILWAIPITQRPDVANLLALRKSETPYPPPASCAVTSWDGPADHDAPYSADYWITGQGMNLDTYMPVYFATQSDLFVVYGNFPKQPNMTGQLSGNTSAVMRSSWIQYGGEGRSGWRGTILFSSPGCWKVSVTDGSAKVDATIYVYPADCIGTQSSGKAKPCKPPA